MERIISTEIPPFQILPRESVDTIVSLAKVRGSPTYGVSQREPKYGRNSLTFDRRDRREDVITAARYTRRVGVKSHGSSANSTTIRGHPCDA